MNACTVNAIPHSCFIRRSFKDMAKMAVTLATPYLSLRCSMARLLYLFNIGLLQLVRKGWPPTATIVFGNRRKEWTAADNAMIDALKLGFVVLI